MIKIFDRLRMHLSILVGLVCLSGLRLLKRQASSLPGYLMQKVDPNILAKLANNKKIIAVTGTNGKTTTAMFIYDFLKLSGEDCYINGSGANLSSGLCTSLLVGRKKSVFVLEVDEACFAKVAFSLAPYVVLVTNLFRDQLDRYGELDAVYNFILSGLKKIPNTRLLLCADDPKVSYLAKDSGHDRDKVFYFGKDFRLSGQINGEVIANLDHPGCYDELVSNSIENSKDCSNSNENFDSSSAAALMASIDVAICPNCGHKLSYAAKSVAQLGNFICNKCSYRRASIDYAFSYERDGVFSIRRTQELIESGKLNTIHRRNKNISEHCAVKAPLDGLYNAYNLAAAVAAADLSTDNTISKMLEACKGMEARFGRQERIRLNNGKEICFILVKNPTGYSQALQLIASATDLGGIAFLLNDNPPDGEDVSWIWDIPFETIKVPETKNVLISGARYEDLALRLSYWGLEITDDNICAEEYACSSCINLIDRIPENTCLYILPNYTSLLRLRRELTEALGLSSKWVKE